MTSEIRVTILGKFDLVCGARISALNGTHFLYRPEEITIVGVLSQPLKFKEIFRSYRSLVTSC